MFHVKHRRSNRNLLKIQVAIKNGDRRWRHARNASRLSHRRRTNSRQLVGNLSRKSGNGTVIEGFWNEPRFGFFESRDLSLLLIDVTGVFEFGFDGCEKVGGKIFMDYGTKVRKKIGQARFGSTKPNGHEWPIVGAKFEVAFDASCCEDFDESRLKSQFGFEPFFAFSRSEAEAKGGWG